MLSHELVMLKLFYLVWKKLLDIIIGTSLINILYFQVCSLEFDRKDISMNKLVATSLEGKFHVFDMRTQHPTKGFASVSEKVKMREINTFLWGGVFILIACFRLINRMSHQVPSRFFAWRELFLIYSCRILKSYSVQRILS